jgi:tetratricopeptide (TPR) repeat protein
LAINRDKVLASAIKLLQGGKYEKAISEFQKLVEDDPKDVRTILKIGDTHVKMGHREQAIANYERVATIYSDQGFYLKAVAVFKQMLRVDSNLPDVHLKLAEMYQQLGLISDCLQHYQQVAVFYEQQGKGADTLQILKRMVDLDPDNLPSRIKLAELFAQQGLNDDAVNEFRSAANHLREQERFDDYVRVAERLIYFDPSAIDVTRELATYYMRRGDAKQALGKLQVCFKADPRDVETLKLISQAFLEMGQVAKTVSVYKEMARIYEGTGATEDALREWNRVLELEPGDDEAKQAIANGGISTGPEAPVAAAPAAAAPAAAAPPSDDEQLRRLLTETDVYVKYGLKDKAVEHLQKIFSIAPDHIDAHDKQRGLYQSMGNRQALVSELRVLVRLGEAAGDARLDGWKRDLETLTAMAPPSPAAASVPEAEPVSVEEVADEELMLVDEPVEEISIDAGDEISLLSGDGEALPPDEGMALPPDEDIVQEDLDAIAAADIPEDALIGVDSGEGPAAAPNEPLLGMPDADLDAAAAEFLSDDAIVPADDLIPDDDVISAEEIIEADAIVEEIVEEAPGELAASPPTMPPEVLQDPGQELSIEQADELVQKALMGMDEDLEESFFGEASGLFDQEALGASQEGAPVEEAAPDSPSEEELMAAAEGALAEMDLEPEGSIPSAPPEEFSLEEQGHSDDIKATVVTELSPDERDQIQGFISQADAQSVGDLGTPLPDASDFGAFADEDAFEDSTVAMAKPAFDALSPSDEPSASDAEPMMTVPAGAPEMPSADEVPQGPSEELDLDRVAAAAAEGLAGFDDVPAPEELPSLEGEEVVPAPPGDDEGDRLGVSDAAHGFEDDPALAFFEEEIEEAEFFIRQELLDEAREIVTEILDGVPESPRAQWMLQRIDAKENGDPEPPAPWAQNIIDEVAEEIGDLIEEEAAFPPEGTEQVSVDEVLSQFKKGVAETVRDDDADTHYNLGIAYREMGLLTDAVTEFRMAANSDSMQIEALHMIGLTHLDLGEEEQALSAFDEALASPLATTEQQGEAEFQKGVVLENLSRGGEALSAYERAQALGADFPDLDKRIQALQAGGAEKKNDGLDDAASFSAEGGAGNSKNIDYV